MMPLNDGYLASPDWSVTESTSGMVPPMTSVAVSPSRLTRTWSPCVSTTEASVTCGTPSRSASMAGHDAHRAVGRGHAAHDQVGDVAPVGLLDGRGQHERGGDRVGPGDRVVLDVHALVDAHLQRLAHGVHGLLGADRHRRDGDVVGVLGLLLEPERLLDGVLVELRQQPVDADAVDGVVSLEVTVRRGVRHVLHANDDRGHGAEATSA